MAGGSGSGGVRSAARPPPTATPYDPPQNCSAKLVAGEVDQKAGMLSEDVQAKGYALLCVSVPQGDCSVRVIPEVRRGVRALP